MKSPNQAPRVHDPRLLSGVPSSYYLSVARKAGEMRLLFALFLSLVLFAPATAQESAPDGQAAHPADLTETELKQQLVGKYLYLRGRYLDDSLSFNEHGQLWDNSPQGSFTLSVIRIDNLNLSRHKLELRGARYALHFLGALSSQEPTSTVDHVRITPPKKWVRITIARMKVVKPPKNRKGAPATQQLPPQAYATTTTSTAYADMALTQAIGNVFATTLDARLIAALPDCWRAYYQAASNKTGVEPNPPGLLGVSDVDRKPTLIGNLEAPSNQYAQDHAIAGVALYRAVVNADGTPQEISIAHPIGFGLDENAVNAIQAARFEPAMKNGKAVPVLLDLVVEFRIYSKHDEADATTPGASTKPSLPGPYTAGPH